MVDKTLDHSSWGSECPVVGSVELVMLRMFGCAVNRCLFLKLAVEKMISERLPSVGKESKVFIYKSNNLHNWRLVFTFKLYAYMIQRPRINILETYETYRS